MHKTLRMSPAKRLTPEDYFVMTYKNRSGKWTWELCRNSYPLGIKVQGDDFETEEKAERAGAMALDDFLRRLSQEE
jgi:hypothetical protein